MTELNFHQLQKDNEEHYKLLLTLMLTYNKELEEQTLSCSKTTETVFELTRGMLNMQGPFDRHLELCYLGDDLIGFFYGKVDHEGHKGFIKPGYGYIMEFYVVPQFRRYGFGKSMFARLQKLFASHGTKRMYLNPGSAAGISFWEALGFISTGEVSPHNGLLIFEKDVFEIIEVLEKEAKCGYTLTKDHDIVTDDGVKGSGFTFEKIVSPQITAYALNSLQDRINYKGPLARDVSYLEPASGEICRIIYSCGKTVISVRENLSNKLKTYLDTIQLYLETRISSIS